MSFLQKLYALWVSINRTLIKTPIWLFLSLPPFRPRKSWDWRKAYNVRLVRFNNSSGLPSTDPDHRAIKGGLPAEVSANWVEPADPSHIVGELAEFAKFAKVETCRIPAYWYHLPKQPLLGDSPPVSPDEKIILAFHGGGYRILSAHPSSSCQSQTRDTLTAVSKKTSNIKRILSLEYRLTTDTSNPFPAALLDAVSGYSYLVNTIGFKPENIVLMGDSAGGHLAINLARYLVRNPECGLKPPGGVIAQCPWADMGTSQRGPGTSSEKNLESDFMVRETYVAAKAFVAPRSWEAVNASPDPYLMPGSKYISAERAQGIFEGFPKTFVTAGGGEILYDGIVTMVERMKADMGERVTFYEGKDAVHVFCAFDWAQPEKSEAYDKIGDWFVKL
ncbi:alpha/beta-hydrolase [Sistotremastrum suecicum HHB10207 ss-3]|uniref:Alpha/beta-hydrolase n=1 Tax=Sistotremastrum suecicum HHB10207 ss-3 TaxID=1314776 RepID=A0A166FMJ8_9AGAM|nr:alpha/beta-hydrolase [Sistotremastrum suecicum HHB10207 ss-3]